MRGVSSLTFDQLKAWLCVCKCVCAHVRVRLRMQAGACTSASAFYAASPWKQSTLWIQEDNDVLGGKKWAKGHGEKLFASASLVPGNVCLTYANEVFIFWRRKFQTDRFALCDKARDSPTEHGPTERFLGLTYLRYCSQEQRAAASYWSTAVLH